MQLGGSAFVRFDDWTRDRRVASLGTNAGSEELPFQGWRRFKEAFTPELIRRAVEASPVRVRHCLDPFAGSGTTALASQFLGVRPTTIEVNPYLADLAEAKLSRYDHRELASDFGRWVAAGTSLEVDPRTLFVAAPKTFVEPGVNDRWLFNHDVAARIAAYVVALDQVKSSVNRRLFRSLLGGVLVDVSNVVVSGKGRRYRGGWANRKVSPVDLDNAIFGAIESAVKDIVKFSNRLETEYSIFRGDCIATLEKEGIAADLAVFSPPYPNSFDYTDVYNLELWGLGYLNSSESNQRLRRATLSSHVQILRNFRQAPHGSDLLAQTLRALKENRQKLWDTRIPEMVAGYFGDMYRVMELVASKLPVKGQMWMVVGDSRYAGIDVPVAAILAELAPLLGCEVIEVEPCRSMRASAQQGGDPSLAETLVVLGRR